MNVQYKSKEFIDQYENFQLPKKDSSPGSLLLAKMTRVISAVISCDQT